LEKQDELKLKEDGSQEEQEEQEEKVTFD